MMSPAILDAWRMRVHNVEVMRIMLADIHEQVEESDAAEGVTMDARRAMVLFRRRVHEAEAYAKLATAAGDQVLSLLERGQAAERQGA